MELSEAFRTQAAACGRLGSPLYDELLHRVADELAGDGAYGPILRSVLRGHEDDSGPSALALRLAGSVHRLVLAGEAPGLASYLPSTGGAWDLAAAWPEFVAVLADRREDVRALLLRAPQTNEVGRSAALVGGLLRVAADLPVRLFEIGASAGLNLRADAFRHVDDAGRSWGPPDSPVVLDPAWAGVALESGRSLEIVVRAGCDVSPVDPLTDDGRLTLSAYVWPDQADRRDRLRGALEVAARLPASVAAVDAAAFVESLDLAPGHTTVLWHSVMWQYVPAAQQQRVTARLSALGSHASETQPLIHLYAEPLRRSPGAEHEFLVCAEQWPAPRRTDAGRRRILGRMAPHGLPTTWEPLPWTPGRAP